MPTFEQYPQDDRLRPEDVLILQDSGGTKHVTLQQLNDFLSEEGIAVSRIDTNVVDNEVTLTFFFDSGNSINASFPLPESGTGDVESVNGILPDADGNVVVPLPFLSDTTVTITPAQAAAIEQNSLKETDRTVVLTEGGNVTITGTYPNFTIAATDTNTQLSSSDVVGFIQALTTLTLSGNPPDASNDTTVATTAWVRDHLGSPSTPGGGGTFHNQNAFHTISAPGQSDVVADEVEDTLTLTGTGSVSITTNPDTDVITISGDQIRYTSGGAAPRILTSIDINTDGDVLTLTDGITPIQLTGAQGEDGTEILSGVNTPQTAQGRDGDFYIQFVSSTSTLLYGPKATTWPTQTVELHGQMGDRGLQGTSIRFEGNAPTTGEYNEGDLVIVPDGDDTLLYGPQMSDGTYGTPRSIRGQQGEQGDQGRYDITIYRLFADGDTVPGNVNFNVSDAGVVALSDSWTLTPLDEVDGSAVYTGVTTFDPTTGAALHSFIVTRFREPGSQGEPGPESTVPGPQGRYNISVFQSFAVGDTIPATVTFNIGADGAITSGLGDWSLTPTIVDDEDLYEGRYNFDPAGGAVVNASFAVFRAGEAGPAGMDGDSAFEIFVTETGNPDGLTEAQWIASLEGTSVTVTDTADGAVVSDGITAVTITDGQDGSPGDNGDQGFYTVFININSATAPTVFGGDGIITPPTNGDGGLSWSFAQNFADDGVDPVYQSAAVFNPALPDAVLTWAAPYLATGSAGPAGPSGTPGTIRVGGQDYTTLSLANSDDIVFVDNSGVISAELADGAGGAGSVDSYVDADGNVILLLDDTTIEFYETEIADNSPSSRLTLGNVGRNVDTGDIIQFPGINGLFGGRPISTRGFLVTSVSPPEVVGSLVDIDENITFTFPAGTQFKLFKTGTGTRRTVVTNNNQLTNGAGYITDNGVDANPPLVGTEQTLNSVTIDNTTYKIVGGGGTSPTTADREAFFGVSPTDPGGLVLDALLTEAPGNAHNGQVLGPFTYTGVGPVFPDQFAIINLPSSLVDGHTVTFNWGSTASGPFFVQAEDVDSYGDLLDVHETYIMGFADTIYIQVHINPIT